MLKVTVRASGLLPEDASLWAQVSAEFADAAGKLIIERVQAVLGTDALGITLSDAYAARKPRLPEYKHVAGKPDLQPGILSGDHIYNALVCRPEGDGVIVGIDPAAALAKGFDVAQAIEERGHYLELGLMAALPDLGPLLGRIVMSKLFASGR